VPIPKSPSTPGKILVHGERVAQFSQETSPEVLIAEAQLREAQAKLQLARIEAAQRDIENSQVQRIVELAQKNVKELERRVENGIAPQHELLEAQERLAQAEAAVAKLRAASEIMEPAGMPGLDTAFNATTLFRLPVPRPELAKDDDSPVMNALNAPINIEFEDETLRNISGFISEYVGVNIVMDVALRAADEPVSLKLEDIPFRDALLALADAYGDVCFVIRDYGVFATTTERAMSINAPTIPANVPLLVSMQEASAGGLGSKGFAVGWPGGADGGRFDFGSGSAAGGGFGGGIGRIGSETSLPGGARRGGFGDRGTSGFGGVESEPQTEPSPEDQGQASP
jgi:hypothetical protein